MPERSYRFPLGGAVAVDVAAPLPVTAGKEETPERAPQLTAARLTEQVPGVTDAGILSGTHFPLRGRRAGACAPMASGTKAGFDYINDTASMSPTEHRPVEIEV